MREHFYGGIDVSKDRLDVMVLPDWKSFSVDNNAAGYSELVKRLRDLPIAAIGIEPSGRVRRSLNPSPAGGGPVGATHQPQQAAPVRPCPWRARQERPARCPADRRIRHDPGNTAPGGRDLPTATRARWAP